MVGVDSLEEKTHEEGDAFSLPSVVTWFTSSREKQAADPIAQAFPKDQTLSRVL